MLKQVIMTVHDRCSEVIFTTYQDGTECKLLFWYEKCDRMNDATIHVSLERHSEGEVHTRHGCIQVHDLENDSNQSR